MSPGRADAPATRGAVEFDPVTRVVLEIPIDPDRARCEDNHDLDVQA